MYDYLRCIFFFSSKLLLLFLPDLFFQGRNHCYYPMKVRKNVFFLFRFVWSRYNNYYNNSNSNNNSSNSNSVMGIWISDTAKVSSDAKKMRQKTIQVSFSVKSSNWIFYDIGNQWKGLWCKLFVILVTASTFDLILITVYTRV